MPGVVSHVPENHGLDRDRGSPLVGDPLDAPVGDGPLAVPALEDRPDSSPKLLLGVFGEILAEHFPHLRLVHPDEALQILRAQVRVLLHSLGTLDLIQLPFQLLADPHSLRGLDPLCFLHDDIGVHLDEAAVGVVDEARVAGGLDDPFRGLLIQADVQDGLHHAGHRLARARAHGHQEGIRRVSERVAHDLLDVSQAVGHLLVESRRVLALVLKEVRAHLGGDREAGGDGKPQVGMAGHFRKVGSFSAQEVLHLLIAVRPTPAEQVHELRCAHIPLPLSLRLDCLDCMLPKLVIG